MLSEMILGSVAMTHQVGNMKIHPLGQIFFRKYTYLFVCLVNVFCIRSHIKAVSYAQTSVFFSVAVLSFYLGPDPDLTSQHKWIHDRQGIIAS